LRTSVERRRRSGSIARAVAKKVRTPPPPRKVQAPQRRDPKRRDGRGAAPPRTGIPSTWVAAGGAVALVAIGLLVFFLVHGNGGGAGGGSRSAAVPTSAFNSLPGVRKTKAPWTPEYARLADRLQPLGLSQLSQEQLVYHVHQHLDIFVNGKPVAGGVPQLIGINDSAYLTELHTHSSDGIIHVESGKKVDYTLGQFFAEWGVFLSPTCVGAYCNGLSWYVNGERRTGNPQNLVLKNHEEIAIVVGKPPKTIPKTFDWAAHGV
jgi:hypothetical protein